MKPTDLACCANCMHYGPGSCSGIDDGTGRCEGWEPKPSRSERIAGVAFCLLVAGIIICVIIRAAGGC